MPWPALTAAAVNLSTLFIALLRRNSEASPLKVFVPLLVTTLMTPPARPPYSAGAWLVNTLNSWIAACGKSCRGSPAFVDMFIVPSARLLLVNWSVPAPTCALLRRGRVPSWLVPGRSSASVTAARFATGSISICCCVMTAATSLFVTSTTGACPVTTSDSVRVLRLIEMSWRISRLMEIARFVTVAVVKPTSSAFSSYLPSGTAPNRY